MTMSSAEPVAQTDGLPDVLPILTINEAVIFPLMVVPMAINGEPWVRLVDDVALGNKQLAVFWRSEPGDDFDPLKLAATGTGAQILRMARLPDGGVQLLLQGQGRVAIDQILTGEPYPQARVRQIIEPTEMSVEAEGLSRSLRGTYQEIIRQNPGLPDELALAAANITAPGTLADFIAANLGLEAAEQQQVLDAHELVPRLRTVMSFLERERELQAIGRRASEEMSKTQREYVLRQQLEAIRRELGETDERGAEIAELRRRLEKAHLPEEPLREAERELERLERMPPGAAEHTVTRTYLDWLIGLPWNTSTPDDLDLHRAREVLDADHYDLEKIKERIIEYLAVRKLLVEQGEERSRGPIICFVGPPGVGKTSLGQSIARALDRKFIRVSLGGVRDEAEIRGFRRTYIGAIPGRIIQGISRGGSNNPVFMLDEVDKLSVGFQGDPAAALLELLDPAQNHAFVDRYLDVPFDMSRVLFLCTANQIDTIPGPLLDRMELLMLAGYTEAEKLVIAERYLLPRQQAEQGLADRAPAISTEAVRRIIREYTHEAGVRDLERRIGAVYRKMATRLASGQTLPTQVEPGDLDALLGVPRFRNEQLLGADEVGVVTGLAWTPTGGDILFVEASAIPGSGQLVLTGQLGDVMRESARAALTYARGRAAMLNLAPEFAQQRDIHIHVPAGAVPKDGPSAGITMAVALASALTGRPAYKHVAMTGEITLRGKVLPIGGLKEKLLAAQRSGVTTVLVPQDNEPDLRDVPEETRDKLEIVTVEHMDQVLERALYPAAAAVSTPDGGNARERP